MIPFASKFRFTKYSLLTNHESPCDKEQDSEDAPNQPIKVGWSTTQVLLCLAVLIPLSMSIGYILHFPGSQSPLGKCYPRNLD